MTDRAGSSADTSLASTSDSASNDRRSRSHAGTVGRVLAGLSASLAGCQSLGSDSTPTLQRVEGVVRERLTARVVFPDGVDQPSPAALGATVSFDAASTSLNATVERVDANVYELSTRGPILSGTPAVTVDLAAEDRTWSLSGTAAVAPRPFVTDEFLGVDYGHDYLATGGVLSRDRIASLLSPATEWPSLESAATRIRDLTTRLGVDATGDAGTPERVAALSLVQRAHAERADRPVNVDVRALARVPRKFDDRVVAVRETTRRYGDALTPAVVVVQGDTAPDVVDVGITSLDDTSADVLDANVSPSPAADAGTIESVAYDWPISASGTYGILGFEPIALPSDSTTASSVAVVPTVGNRRGFAARVALRRDLTAFEPATSFSDEFATDGTGYDPSQWTRRTSEGGVTRQAGDDRLRVAAHPLSHVALVSTALFEPPVRLTVEVDGVTTPDGSGLYVGWFDPETFLSFLFGGERIPYRVGCVLVERLAEVEGMDAVREGFHIDSAEFTEQYDWVLDEYRSDR